MTRWELDPTSEQVAEFKMPNGLRSNNEAAKLALKKNLTECLEGINEEDLSPEMQSLHAVLWHVLDSFI